MNTQEFNRYYLANSSANYFLAPRSKSRQQMAQVEKARFQLKNMVNRSGYRSRYSNSNTPRSRRSSVSAHSHYTHGKNEYLSIPNIERTPCYGKHVETRSSNPMERGDLDATGKKSPRSSDGRVTVP